jgi:hypothetical protein
MSKVLEEFLALRDIAAGHRYMHFPSVDVGTCSPPPACIEPVDTMGNVVVETNGRVLASVLAGLLARHASADRLTDRLDLADHLSRGILSVFHCAPHIDNGRQRCVGQCPAGHLDAKPIETRQLIGWACDACERVYDIGEFRPVYVSDVLASRKGAPELSVFDLE